MNQLPVTEQELQAYVDDLLPAARRAEIEAYLQARPAEAERIAAYREQNHTLHALFDPVLQQPAPRHLTLPPSLPPSFPQSLSPSLPPSQPLWSPPLSAPPAPAANLGLFASHWRQLAACAVLALCSGIGGWLLHGATAQNGNPVMATASENVNANANAGHGEHATYIQAENDALPRHAAIAHVTFSPEVRHPVEVGIDQEAHLVAWLSKRLGTSLRPPKLHTLGYDLIGGRLLPGDDGPVAQFMYQDKAGARLTLYVSTEQDSKHETAFRFSQEGGVSVFYWIDGKFGYALSAAMPRDALGHIADTVYGQLEQAS